MQTPVMQQYMDIKDTCRDAILFFRMGDFYEMFGQDAVVASRILQIALTSRDKGKKDQVPMCGLPHFAAEGYIEKLVRAGHKVAICEQVGDSTSYGIVKRELVRVITPGTYKPDDEKENAYILSLYEQGNKFGYAAADITTGEFLLFESSNDILDEISRFEPREVLLPESFKNKPSIIDRLERFYITAFEDWHFDYMESYRTLLKSFRVASLEGFGCEGLTIAIAAAGALITYLADLQRGNIPFKTIKVLHQYRYMTLDASTWRNLEIDRNLKDQSREGTLLWTIDTTLTPMGGRLLRAWLHHILLDVDEIRKRQAAVRFFYENFTLLSTLTSQMKKIQDMERLVLKLTLGSATARELLSLGQSLKHLPEIKKALSETDNPFVAELTAAIDTMPDVAAFIDKAIADEPPASVRDGGLIRDGFNPQIDEYRQITQKGKDYIASIEAAEKKRTGIATLKIGFNKIYGYYIEVSKSNLSQVPAEYIRKQTLVNAERFITPELKSYEDKVLGADEKLKNLEYAVFVEIREQIAKEAERIQTTSGAIAALDVLSSLAVIARRYNYEQPCVDRGEVLRITEGRHPVIERTFQNERFVPNDVYLDAANHTIAIITGPNMAGKSTYMRQTALIVILAQIGSFVPAKDAVIGVVDRIFTRIGAADYLAKGQSTFMVEMMETANIVNNATSRSLIILDEIGRGTSTFDGISIAWAVVEHLAKKIKPRTLFATHYHELTELALVTDNVKNLNVLIREWGDEIIFLRKIQAGPADKSYGIQVGRLAGLPDSVIQRSKEILANLENGAFNEEGAPKIAKKRGRRKKHDAQLSLFASPEDLIREEILSLDFSKLNSDAALHKLIEMKQRLSQEVGGI